MSMMPRSRTGIQFAGVMVAGLGLVVGMTACPGKGSDGGSAPAQSSAPATAAAPPPVKSAAPPPPPPSAPPPPAANAAPPGMERFADVAADNQIDVPTDWTHTPVGDHLLIQSPDKAIFIELSASLAMGKDKADEKKLMARLEKSLQKAKRMTPIQKASQNGLNGWAFGGTAQKDKKPYDWESFALEDAAGKGAFGLVYASTADLKSHRAIIDKILGSISAVTK
jgi:hypothetical protein